MTKDLPSGFSEFLDYAFPDYLDEETVIHSEVSVTTVVLDLDYRYRTFRANLSLDGRWTLCPLSGFDERIEPQETLKELTCQSTQAAPKLTRPSTPMWTAIRD